MNPIPAHTKDLVVSLLEEAFTCRINNLAHSVALSEKALYISREIGDKSRLTGRSLNQLSLFRYDYGGEHKHSMEMSDEAITYFEELQDEKGIADAKYNLAGILYKTNNYHLGLLHLIDCLKIYRKFNDDYNQARVQKSLGTIL